MRQSVKYARLLEFLQDWMLALIGLALILVGSALLAYTKFLGGAIILFSLGGLLVVFNIAMAWEATTRGSEGNDFY